MCQLPFHLRYQLTRRQRLLPHLRIWGVAFTLYAVALFSFFCVETALSACLLLWQNVAVCGFLAFGIFALAHGLFVGLMDVLLVKVRTVDVIVEENAAGVLLAGQRWYLFLEGLLSVEQLTPGVWTLQHFNGVVLHIPAGAITDAQVAHLRAAMQRGRTPEGVRAVIERGRALEQIERS